MSLLFAVAGPAWLVYQHIAEVPKARPGFVCRFAARSGSAGPAGAAGRMELEGQRIFIKGYIYPGRTKEGIRQFLLVRDQGDCCFGGNPKITDRIQVTLVDPLRINFKSRLHKVAGKFHVKPLSQATDGAKGGVFYHLEADYVQ